MELQGRKTVTQARQWAMALFSQQKGTDFSLDVRLLLAQALEITPESFLSLSPSHLLTPAQEDLFSDLVYRRLQGEPLSRIRGYREFWSLPFTLSPETLDPRPDSEIVVELALSSLGNRQKSWTLMDWGTGSGCLLLSLLHECPHALGIGIDLSPKALQTAQYNALQLGLHPRCHFLASSWGEALQSEKADLIISNPPYIPRSEISFLEPEVQFHDPLLALEGGESGLDAYKTLIPQAYDCLKSGGILVLELGAGQKKEVEEILLSHGFHSLQTQTDLSNIDRAIAGKK